MLQQMRSLIAVAERREEELSHQTNEYQATAELGIETNACSGFSRSRQRNKAARWDCAQTLVPTQQGQQMGGARKTKKGKVYHREEQDIINLDEN